MANENQPTSLSENLVASKIYLIREQRVMLDKDLAELYEVETRALNQAVSRNTRSKRNLIYQHDFIINVIL